MLLTVGHGTLELEQLTDLLHGAGVTRLVDVRRFPGSRRLPQFRRESLETSVPAAGMDYEWVSALGGRRRGQPESPNVGLTNPAFRAYADHMASAEFRTALARLVDESRDGQLAVMCAESVWWRCHRRLIADAAVLGHGLEVLHLFHDGRRQPHPPLPSARVDERGVVVYDLDQPRQFPV